MDTSSPEGSGYDAITTAASSDTPALAPDTARLTARPGRQQKPTLASLTKERLIGVGVDGKVFLARDSHGVSYALKEMILADNQLKRAESVKRQIEALQAIPRHDNIVRHYGVHLGTCSMHVIMEYVPGGSISSLLSTLGAFHESAVRDFARQLCRGLAFLHSHNVVHRDIKGANCLVNSDGRLQIADFGSSVVGEPSPGDRGLQGTAHWMSPESIREEITPKTDIWALGCTIIEMATGRSPWAAARFQNDWAAMFHISQCRRGPPIPPHLSRQAHAFLRSCFEVDPALRPTAEACLAIPFLADPFDETNPDMLPPDADELTPYDGVPNRDDSPLGTDYASTFSSVSFAPIDPEWGDAEHQLETPDNLALAAGAPSDSDSALSGANTQQRRSSKRRVTRASLPPIHGGERESAATRRASADSDSDSDGPIPDLHTPTTQSVHKAFPTVRPEDVRACVAAASTGGIVVMPTSSAAVSLVPVNQSVAMMMMMMQKSALGLQRLEEALMFNILTFLPHTSLGRASCVSRQLHELIDQDAKERLWRRLFTGVFGSVDDVRATLRKSWKDAFRASNAAKSWSAANGRFKIVRRLAYSANVFEAIDTQGGSAEPTPCVIKVEQLPRPKSRAVSTPLRRPGPVPAPLHHPQSPGRLLPATTSARAFAGQTPSYALPSPSKPPPGQLPGLPHAPLPPLAPDATTGKLPTQGGRFTFIKPSNGAIINAPGVPPMAPPPLPPPHHGVPSIGGLPLGGLYASPARVASPPAHLVANSSSGTFASPPVASTAQGVVPPPLGTVDRTRPEWHDLYDYQRAESTNAPTPKPNRSTAQLQYRLLRHLDAMGVQCVPKPLHLSPDGSDIPGYSALVTSALGPSLSELLLYSGNQLSTRTVMTLALKLLMSLADMHDRDVVHGGITPSNVVMGTGPTKDNVYFVNFSHGRFHRDPKTHKPVSNVINSSAKRSYEFYCFCSTSVQRGCTPSPRDDVVSVGYVLCYLTHGGLPWSADGIHLDGEKLVRAKNQYLETLATTPPLQLHHFLKSGYALRQGDTPDYVYLCNLVRRMMRERGWAPDAPLDWDLHAAAAAQR